MSLLISTGVEGNGETTHGRLRVLFTLVSLWRLRVSLNSLRSTRCQRDDHPCLIYLDVVDMRSMCKV